MQCVAVHFIKCVLLPQVRYSMLHTLNTYLCTYVSLRMHVCACMYAGGNGMQRSRAHSSASTPSTHALDGAQVRVHFYIIYVHIVYIYTYTHSGISGTWLIRMCDMTQSYVWHEAFTCVTTNTHCIGASALSAHALGDTQVCVYVCYTHIYIDSFLRGTWLIRTWLIRTCDMTHSWTR